jgi:hypothetical protein
MTTTNRKALATLRPRKKPTLTRVRWTAGDAAGVAHAHMSGRTACRAPSVAERFAWPSVIRCPACLASLGRGHPSCRGPNIQNGHPDAGSLTYDGR